MCNENIGDEIHYLFICKSPELVRIRENLIPEYYTRYPNKQKLSGLLSHCNVNLYKKISSFIKKLDNILWNINVLCLLNLSYFFNAWYCKYILCYSYIMKHYCIVRFVPVHFVISCLILYIYLMLHICVWALFNKILRTKKILTILIRIVI